MTEDEPTSQSYTYEIRCIGCGRTAEMTVIAGQT